MRYVEGCKEVHHKADLAAALVLQARAALWKERSCYAVLGTLKVP